MSKLFLALFVLFSTFLLAACSSSQSVNSSVNTRNEDVNAIEEKVGETELSGRVVKSGEKFFVVKKDGSETEIDSYSLDLASYVNQEISVTGQYSGNTLFVTKIQ